MNPLGLLCGTICIMLLVWPVPAAVLMGNGALLGGCTLHQAAGLGYFDM
jgi:hypothetical protein